MSKWQSLGKLNPRSLHRSLCEPHNPSFCLINYAVPPMIYSLNTYLIAYFTPSALFMGSCHGIFIDLSPFLAIAC
jgi:hypothetical protein